MIDCDNELRKIVFEDSAKNCRIRVRIARESKRADTPTSENGATHMAWWSEFTAHKVPSIRYYSHHHHEHWWVVLGRAVKIFFYSHFLDMLYYGLTIFTFSYLAFVVWAFFDQNNIPIVVTRAVDALAEPYLGTLGVYLVVKEIRQRLGKKTHKHFADLIVAAWLILMLASSLLTVFSASYHFNIVYRHIVTNSLAALIIRIGTFLHY